MRHLVNRKRCRDIVKDSSTPESPEKSVMAKAGLQGHRRRLRERFVKSGLAGFHDHEILELLLTYAIPRKDVKPIAKDLLNEFGNNLASVFDAPAEALQRIEGVGGQAAVLIGLMPRLFDSYQSSRWVRHETFGSTEAAVSYLQALLGTQRNEIFCVLALDSQNRLIAVERVQRGSVNRTAVFPRQVVEASLKHRATAVILAHNHPGGGPLPSAADRQLTQRLRKILGELDIVVHDHIIIAGHNQFYSFAQTGGLE
jgi:DNA repair protein RadC